MQKAYYKNYNVNLQNCNNVVNNFLNDVENVYHIFCYNIDQFSNEFYCELTFDKINDNYVISFISDEERGQWSYRNEITIIIDKKNKQKICNMLQERNNHMKEMLNLKT